MTAIARAADQWGVGEPPPVETYADWMTAQGMSDRTVQQRVDFAAWRLREWETWEVSRAVIARWLGTYSSWTRITYHSHLVSIYKWLLETGQVDRSPMEGMKRPPLPSSKPRPLSRAEEEAILEGITGHLRAWMMLGLYAGLRVHEIAKLCGEDVTKTEIRVVGKGGKDASVPTHPDLWDIAHLYPRRGMWFPSPLRAGCSYSPDHISGEIADRFRAVGIEHGSIHRLRATFGTNLVRAGANLRVVQTLMRHSSLATTERYLGVDEDERTAAVRLLGGGRQA